jgi:hypothetical protein
MLQAQAQTQQLRGADEGHQSRPKTPGFSRPVSPAASAAATSGLTTRASFQTAYVKPVFSPLDVRTVRASVFLAPELISQLTVEADRLASAAREEQDNKAVAAILTLRGAILRVLGRLDDALGVLTTVVDSVMLLGEAFWQRHLVWLAYSQDDMAIKDLVSMARCETTLAYKLFRSRADMFFRLGRYEEAAADYHVRLGYRQYIVA